MEADWKPLLAQEPLLAEFPAALREIATPLRLAAGERLFSIGGRPRQMFYVLSGEVRLTRASRAGGEIIIQRAHHGFIAEASLELSAYHCDAMAAAASAVLRFPMAEFRRLLEADAAFRAVWTALLAREVRKLRARCERLSLKSAEARILHYLESETHDDRGALVPSRKAWAAELGLTHEALYRNLARLEKAGRIRIEGKLIGLPR